MMKTMLARYNIVVYEVVTVGSVVVEYTQIDRTDLNLYIIRIKLYET